MAGDFFDAGFMGRDAWANPFADMATHYIPHQHKNALKLCEYVFTKQSTYRMAAERVISYFLTEVEVGSPSAAPVSDDEKEKYQVYLHETLGILGKLQDVLREFWCYGNSFVSVVVPFTRILVCPTKGCTAQFPLRVVGDPKNQETFAFKFINYEFEATCPKCRQRSKWDIFDLPDTDETRLKLKRWSPHEIEIQHDIATDDCRYLWRIPEQYKRELASGNLFVLERASKEVIRAVKNNMAFMFNQDAIYHMKEPCLAGIRNRGWGISRTLTNFSDVYYVEVLRRQNEAIALDYVTPLRIITPDARPGTGETGADPLRGVNAGGFMSNVRSMWRRKRIDPAQIQTLPYPVKYQVLGGEATQLAPRDLLDQGLDTLLNGTGVPVELYKGSLTLQAAPVALRQFEATWQHLVHNMNDMLNWLVKQISQILSWESVNAKMRRVTYVDDINQQMAMLQLMMGNSLSGTTAFRSMGLNWKDEMRRMAEEEKFRQEQQAEIAEEASQAAFAEQLAKGQVGSAPAQGQQGGAPQGGDPNAMPMAQPATQYLSNQSPSTPRTPEDMMADASAIANELTGLPDTQRRSELMALKKKDEAMHRLVKAELEDIRSRARTSGQAMLMQQQQGAPVQ